MRKTILLFISLLMLLPLLLVPHNAEEYRTYGNSLSFHKSVTSDTDLISIVPDYYSLTGNTYTVTDTLGNTVGEFVLDTQGNAPMLTGLKDDTYYVRETVSAKGFPRDTNVYECTLSADYHLPVRMTVDNVTSLYGYDAPGIVWRTNNQDLYWVMEYGTGTLICGIDDIKAPTAVQPYGETEIDTSDFEILPRNSETNELIYKIMYYGRGGLNGSTWPDLETHLARAPFISRNGSTIYDAGISKTDALMSYITHACVSKAWGKSIKNYHFRQYGASAFYEWVQQQELAPVNFIVYLWPNFESAHQQDMFLSTVLEETDYQSVQLKAETKPLFPMAIPAIIKKNSNDEPVSSAGYSVSYFNETLSSLEEALSMTPVKTLNTQTDENGMIDLVAEKMFTTEDGLSVLLPGTYLVKETAVPQGYLAHEPFMFTVSLNGTISLSGCPEVQYTDGSFLITETHEGYVYLKKRTVQEVEEFYPLTGAQYTVYSDLVNKVIALINGTDQPAILTVDEHGETNTVALAPGTYYVVETKCPEGYYRDQEAHPVTIRENETAIVTSWEDPILVTLTVQKRDADTLAVNPAEFAGFEGAVYQLWRCRDNDEEEKVAEITLDRFGTGVRDRLFPGRYHLREIVAPNGYLLSDEDYYIDCYPNENNIVDFLIDVYDTSTTLIIRKTDDNGSSVEGALLELQAEDGTVLLTWTTSQEDMIIRGLTIGNTYVIEEKTAPSGYVKSDPVTFTFTSDRQVVEVVNPRRYPLLSTSASYQEADDVFIITDNVTLQQLALNRFYEVKGVLMDKNTGEPFTDESGEMMTASTSFTAKSYDLELEVLFEVPRSLAQGKELVVFEELYENGELVALHNDITDPDQTVMFSKPFTVTAVKCDTEDEEVRLEGCEFTLYSSDGEIAIDTEGEECVKTTDETGEVSFSVPYLEEGYYLQETKAPEGYIIDPQPHPVEKQNDIKITVPNSRETVQTGDISKILTWTLISAVSLASILLILTKRRDND